VEGGVETGEHELRRGEAGQEGDAVGPAAGAVDELRPDGEGVDRGVGAGGTGDGDGEEGSEGEENCWMQCQYGKSLVDEWRGQKGGELTADIIHPEGSVGEKDVVDNHGDVKELIHQEVMPRLRHILWLPADNHRHQRLRRSHCDRRRECNPREHGRETTKVRQMAAPSLGCQNRGEMVLSACRGIDAGQLRQRDASAQHGNSDGDDAVEQRHRPSRLHGNSKTGGDGDPAVGDVVAHGDDAEDAELALHGHVRQAHDDLAGGQFDFQGSIVVRFGTRRCPFAFYLHSQLEDAIWSVV
jgi:hypothetical protein